MAIKFSCPTCGDQVRTPDAMAGRRGKCPHCHALITIPKPASSSPTAVGIGADGKLEFSCFGCGQVVRVPSSAAGKRGECPHCHIVVQIPEAPVVQSRQAVVLTPEGDLEFHCPQCQEMVRTLAAASGKKGMCPHCDATFVIPEPEAPAAQPASEDSTLKLTIPTAAELAERREKKKRESESRSAKPAATKTSGEPVEQIDFGCPECGRKMRVPAGLVGRKGRCPGCQTTLIIPAAGDTAVVRAASKQAETISGLTPIDDLTPIESPPLNIPPAKKRAAAKESLTPIADSGLTPIESGRPALSEVVPGLTPIELPALTPAATSGLTPLIPASLNVIIPEPGDLVPVQKQPAAMTANIVAGVDDGKALIPLRERAVTASLAVSNPYDWSDSSRQDLTPVATTTFSHGHGSGTIRSGTNFALIMTMIGLCVSGLLQIIMGIVLTVAAVNQSSSGVLVTLWIIALLLGILQIVGGILVHLRRGYPWCIAASIAALFSPCFGFPFGILGLIMLLQRHVRAAFR